MKRETWKHCARSAEFSPEMQPTDVEVASIELAGMRDDSWHNNICVSFTRPGGTYVYTLWTDAIKESDREMCGYRFLLQRFSAEYEFDSNLYEGDDLQSALDALPTDGS